MDRALRRPTLRPAARPSRRLITRIAVGVAIAATGPAILVGADLAGTWAAHPAAAAEHAGATAPPPLSR